MNIAVLEDHADLRNLLVAHLSDHGYAVVGAGRAEELDARLAAGPIDLLVLDINLPGEDGFSVAKRLRMSHPRIHIIMLTARTASDDRISGYSSGADSYLPKPVSPDELTAAILSAERRIRSAPDDAPVLEFDRTTHLLKGVRGEVRFGRLESTILEGLAAAPGHRLDYPELFRLLGREPEQQRKGSLEVQVFRIKKKLLEAGAREPAIRAIWKEGYELTAAIQVR